MKFLVSFVIILITRIPHSHSGIPLDRRQSSNSRQDDLSTQTQKGLYNANDRVISLSASDMKESVLGQDYATLLEFYNSFCGHCKRFAPKYKKLADDIWSWRDVVKVMAIDCSEDENNDICREYEVMGYPTLRYFSPKASGEKYTGFDINDQNIERIRRTLVKLLANETQVTDFWPNFSDMSQNEKNDLFKDLPNNIQNIFIIYESENSTLGGELALNYSRATTIKFRRTTSVDVASSFNIESHNTIAVVARNLSIDKISISDIDSMNFKKEIDKYLKRKNLDDGLDAEQTSHTDSEESDNWKAKTEEIINEVKKNKHVVYYADLEKALRYSLFHELTTFNEITGERLLALQRYISTLRRYNPLGEKGQIFLSEIESYVMLHNQQIQGEDLEKTLKELEKQYEPVFSTKQNWIGCRPSKSGLRGFTCGLWELFHFMTVQASETEKSSDPLEVLQAMHGYVKYFFGCTECSNHFQAMAAKRKIWSTASKDDAVLWLWASHNTVNKRLAGDETEDPKFPKIQFPSKESCNQCYRESASGSIDEVDEISWDKVEVLQFLKRIYNPHNISRYGLDDENILPPTLDKIRRKRMVSSIFSDMDMRMVIFLYAFCIGMMVVAVKLFLFKGYRKKIYAYDFLGKT